ncbi:MAG: hypothetical protein ACYDEJ_05600 [Desulfitobacteriaceae bacterium]
MRERGSALLTAVVSVMILLLVTGIFFSFVISQFKMQTNEEKALRAYYLAEAGTNYEIASMIYLIKEYHEVDLTTGDVEDEHKYPFDIQNPFGVTYGGYFSVHVKSIRKESKTEADGKITVIYNMVVNSKGVYQGITRELEKNYAYPDQ